MAMKQRAPFAAITYVMAWAGFSLGLLWAVSAFLLTGNSPQPSIELQGFGQQGFNPFEQRSSMATMILLKFLAMIPGLIMTAMSAASGVLAEMSLNQAKSQNRPRTS